MSRTLALTREQRDRESAEMLVRGNIYSFRRHFSAAPKQRKSHANGRPLKAIDRNHILVSTSLTPAQADRFIALSLAIRAWCLENHGSLASAEKALGWKQDTITNTTRAECGRAHSQLRKLEKIAADLGVTHSIPMANYAEDNGV